MKPFKIVFDGPPGPEGPRFIEVEDLEGRSIKHGQWVEQSDGTWALLFKCEENEGGHNESAVRPFGHVAEDAEKLLAELAGEEAGHCIHRENAECEHPSLLTPPMKCHRQNCPRPALQDDDGFWTLTII